MTGNQSMGMHLENFEKQVTRIMLEQIMEDYDKMETSKFRKRIIDVLKSLRGSSYFLISYDFRNNNSVVKKGLLNSSSDVFLNSFNGKTFPDTTLIWKGPARATKQNAFAAFENQVRKIIESKDLDTELSKTIIIEILDSEIFVDEQ